MEAVSQQRLKVVAHGKVKGGAGHAAVVGGVVHRKPAVAVVAAVL